MADLGWGIAGTGTIARVLGRHITQEPGHRLVGIGSRTPQRAQDLAGELGSARGFGTYAEMIDDPEVDVVYVATPPHEHQAIVELAAAAGKGVLCEKPLAADADSAAAMVAAARQSGIFLMEAMWMRFDPLVRRLSDLVGEGTLGEVRSVTASFGRVIEHTPTERLWDAERAGGCLLDFGVYPLSLGQMLMGEPVRLAVSGVLSESGVDQEVSMLGTYAAGARGLYDISLISALPNTAAVSGTRLRAELDAPLFLSSHLTVKGGHGSVATVHERGFNPNGYVGQLREVARCMELGLGESSVMPLDESVACLALIDGARRSLSRSALGALPVAGEGGTGGGG